MSLQSSPTPSWLQHMVGDERLSSIHVCPLSAVGTIVAETGAAFLVTCINEKLIVPTPSGIEPGNHLRLVMNDIAEPRPGFTAPARDHVERLVAFVRVWDRSAPLLIHCWAGISRSTAAAFTALCALNPDVPEQQIARRLRQASPTAEPNRRIVRLADEVLARDGRMIAAVEAMGSGERAAEGRPFRLRARLV